MPIIYRGSSGLAHFCRAPYKLRLSQVKIPHPAAWGRWRFLRWEGGKDGALAAHPLPGKQQIPPVSLRSRVGMTRVDGGREVRIPTPSASLRAGSPGLGSYFVGLPRTYVRGYHMPPLRG